MAAAARPRRAAETTETRARVAKLGLDPELGAENSYRLPGARERRASDPSSPGSLLSLPTATVFTNRKFPRKLLTRCS